MTTMDASQVAEAVRLGTLRANPLLSGYRPLPKIMYFDDFDHGYHGWTELLGNYEDTLENVTDYPDAMDARPPMLSNAVMHDTGTAGALHGTYALKVATRPRKGHLAKALKRHTFAARGRLQCEAYFTFHPEPSTMKLGEKDVHSFGISYDLQDDDVRYWPAIRFVNAEDGQRVEKWQWHAGGTRLPHLDDWEDLEDGHQQLCYNEVATKQNWHYLRWTIDLDSRQYIDLQCNDRVWDLTGKVHRPLKLYPNLRNLLNLGLFVTTDCDRRAFLYLDSVLLSADEEAAR
ncbi:MAG: DUF6772 family protein [Micromonosporaceae bacterium]